jgi:hypothetical protein
MLNWMLSGICIVLLVLIVYHLSKAMQAFGILHGDLIGQQATEVTAGSPIVTAPLSPQADPFLPYVQQPISLENTDQERPNEATDQSVIEEVTPQFIASIQGTRFHRPDCSSVKKIRYENREYFIHRDEAIASGYDPCTICDP